MTSSPPPPISEPDPSAFTCPGGQVGPCSGCRRATHKYGRGGMPLCRWCLAAAQEDWGSAVRFTRTGPQEGDRRDRP